MKKKLSELEKEIIGRLQAYIDVNKKVDLSILAEECHVAKSTVVKAAKKLGYSGFMELYYQMKKDKQNQVKTNLFTQENLVHGNMKEILDKVAQLFYENKENKNIITSFKAKHTIAEYLSRKLMMFDLFAPATYDYDMIFSPTMKSGVLFLIDIDLEDQEVLKDALLTKKEIGCLMIVLSNRKNKQLMKESELYIELQESQYKTADFTEAKAIVFCELLLAYYSQKYLRGKTYE